MNDTLFHQADTLMRRRSFVAGAKPAEVPESAAADDDSRADLDVPVLTEIVEETAATLIDQPAEPHAAPNEADAAQIEQQLRAQQERLQKSLETWLDEALPKAVAVALDGIGDYLVSELRERARAELLPPAATDPVTKPDHAAADELKEELRNDPL